MNSPPTHHRKLFLKISGIVLMLVFLFTAVAFIYVHLNRDKLGLLLSHKLEETFKGKVLVEKIRFSLLSDFPHLSLTLFNTSVKDSLYGENFLDIEKISLRINLFYLLKRQVSVSAVTLDNGNIFLFKDSSGYSNTSVFQSFGSGKETSGPLSFNIDQFFCNNIAFVFREQIMGKDFSLQLQDVKGKLAQHEDLLDISLSGDVRVDSMMFRRDKGSYLREKQLTLDAQMVYDRKTRELNFMPTTVRMDGQPYALSGCFIVRKPVFLNLYIDNPACDFNIAKTALSKEIQQSLHTVHISEPLGIHIAITGESQPFIPPMVDVFFQLRNHNIKAYKVDFAKMDLHGLFTNHLEAGKINDNSNSGIFLVIKKGRMEYIPFTASLAITDLQKLKCRAKWKTQMDLTDFNQHDDLGNFYFNKGTATLQFSYSGNLSNYKDSIGLTFDDTLSGFLSVSDGVLEYPNRHLRAKKINTDISFTQEEFKIECLEATLNDNEVLLSGTLSGIRRLLSDEAGKMHATFQLFSPSFDISKVLVAKGVSKESFKKKKASSLTLVPAIIKRITDDVMFTVSIKANSLRFRNLTAQEISGNMQLSSRGMALNDFRMNTCRGDIRLSARLDAEGSMDKLHAEAEVRNVDVKNFFRSADNFSQDAITHENLSGQLSATAKFSATLDNQYSPVTDSIRAHVFFSLMDGELTNYEPLANIDNFIFKKRDMNNVRFAEIKDTLLLNGKELTIRKLEVASSVLRLFVKGKYTFNGPAEIYVQVPLSNLKKPDADSAATNLGLEKSLASIFLKVHGTAGKLKVSLSPEGRREWKKD